MQEKQVSPVIKLQGFVASITGVTTIWNEAELLSYGYYAGKNKQADDNPKKHKNSSLQKKTAWPDSNRKILSFQAVALPLRQMIRIVDWIRIYNYQAVPK